MPTYTQETFATPSSEEEYYVHNIIQTGTDFVASGAMVGGTAATHEVLQSADGEVWTAVEAATAFTFGMAYSSSLDRYVIIGDVSGAQHSDDGGATWTQTADADFASASWRSVAWSPTLELFATVSSESSGSSDAFILTSPDGETWTERTPPAGKGLWASVVWSSVFSKFIATSSENGATDNIMYSSDGINWSIGTTPSGFSVGNGRTMDNYAELSSLGMGIWGGTNAIITSTDGTTWTLATQSTDPTFSDRVAHVKALTIDGTDYFIALGTTFAADDSGLQYSTDGITWTVGQAQGAAGDWCPHVYDSSTQKLYLTNHDTSLEPDDLMYVWTFAAADVGGGNTFWYQSDIPGLESAVDATIIDGASARPKGPRGAVHETPFDEDNPLLGYPGHAVAFNNRLLYAKGEYVVGTDLPTIRVWNGTSDYQLCAIPKDANGNTPRCVTTMVNGDGKVYLGTWDTGTTSSNVVGRILRLDPNSGQLTNVGNVNSLTGFIPWSLWFHNGELWAGLHASDTDPGRIYRIKPEEQTAWTLDRDITVDSVGGVTVINAYEGKMYFGTQAASGTFAKFGNRDALGTYGLVYTGTGGTAQDFNGFYASTVFNEELYFSFWNPDATPISLIKKYDGTTVSTAYDVTDTADVPIIGLFVHNGVLYAIGSRLVGTTWTSVVLTTADGTTWADRTGDLPLGDFTSRGLANAFAVIAY